MADYQTISLGFDGPVGRLTLNRPGSLNALSFEALRELRRAIEETKARDNCSVLILEGAGRAFSVGFDLQSLAGMMVGGALPSEEDLRAAAQLGEEVIEALRELDIVTIASVHGYVIGGGFLLMSACDFRVAEDNTIFSIPEVDMGIPLLWGGVPILVEVLGPNLARDLVMTCRKFGVKDLPHNGFIYRTVSSLERQTEVDRLAVDLSQKPALALRLSKQQFQQTSGVQIPGAPQNDGERFSAAVLAPDFLSTAMAYMQKVGGK